MFLNGALAFNVRWFVCVPRALTLSIYSFVQIIYEFCMIVRKMVVVFLNSVNRRLIL